MNAFLGELSVGVWEKGEVGDCRQSPRGGSEGGSSTLGGQWGMGSWVESGRGISRWGSKHPGEAMGKGEQLEGWWGRDQHLREAVRKRKHPEWAAGQQELWCGCSRN